MGPTIVTVAERDGTSMAASQHYPSPDMRLGRTKTGP